MKNFLISCLDSRVEADGVLYGRYLFGPVPRGLAVTIGTALRRSLLSEVTGLAITHVEIVGIEHEYSVLPGTRETVLDILLNLKKLIFTSTTKARQQALAYISVRGPGIITGHDLKLPPGIQCVNPDQIIAHLADDGYANFKCLVSSGKNYIIQSGEANISPLFGKDSSGDDHEILNKRKTKRHIFPMDAVFMPVIRVNFVIQSDEDVLNFPLHVKSQDVTERVIFEIWTNGTLTPRQALDQAASELIRVFSMFQNSESPKPILRRSFFQQDLKDPLLALKAENSSLSESPNIPSLQLMYEPNHFVDIDIGILPISPSLYLQLKAYQFERIGDFLGKSYEELLQIPNMTSETLFAILCHLRCYGMQLRSLSTPGALV